MGDKRYERLKSNLNRLQSDIAAKKILNKEIPLDADILDINALGIKVRLDKPLRASIEDRVLIKLTLPDSGGELTIHGQLKNTPPQRENSMFVDEKRSIDDLIYDCVRLSENTLLIKTR